MTMLTLFKSTLPYLNVPMSNPGLGNVAFVNGRFATDNPEIISALTEAVKQRHPLIFIDEQETQVDSELQTPEQILRAQIRAQILAEMAAADPSKDMGKSDQSLGKIGNTQNVQEAMAGGSGVSQALRLAQLTEQARKAALAGDNVPSAGLTSAEQSGLVDLKEPVLPAGIIAVER